MIRQAGGIVVRCQGGSRRYLLVRAKKHPERWIFPKGHIQEGESAEEAAVREVKEEAGVVARVIGPAGVAEFSRDGGKIRAQYFWMTYVRAAARGEEGRDPRWCCKEEALALLTHPVSRRMLTGRRP
jgi:ADP-ribose pyrophosphatase YjhB (NUDIX family)